MRVLLAGPDLESNLSLRYLASSLRAAGHTAVIATFDSAADLPAVVAAARGAELVGLSMCFQLRAPEFLALAAALKAEAPDRPVVAGGHFASCAAQELLRDFPQLDVVVVHEGEQALVELANLGPALVARAGELRGVAVRRDGRPVLTPSRGILDDLDGLPPPDRSGPARLVAGVPTAYLMGSRGCVNACDYCCITTLHRLAPGRRFRQRSPSNVAAEMACLYHQRGVRQFVFHDDNFLVPSYAHNSARIEALAGALDGHGVRDVALVLKCSPKDAERRILTRLKELGLIRIFMGIESGTQCGLDAIGRRQTVAEAEAALTLCEALDVSSQYTLITFHPEATAESMLEDLAFARRHPQHPLNYCRAEVYAGTPLEERLVSAGRALGTYMGRAYRYTDERVERVWEVGSELFGGRCWGKDELLGQAIRLDHQVTVVRHFYEGPAVRRLVRGFRDFQVELNLGTAALFAELVELCADPALGDAARERARADLERRERASREALLARLCAFRVDIERCTRLAFPAVVRPPPPRPAKRVRNVVARHAAAVAVALGLATLPASGQGPRPTPKPATEPQKKRGAADGGQPAAPTPVEAVPFRQDVGVAEAAPPPWRDDIGVAEAAPPPWDRVKRRPPPPPPPPPPRRDAGQPQDAGTTNGLGVGVGPDWRNDIGVAEAAPPPWDPNRNRVAPDRALVEGWSELAISAPGYTVYLAGVGAVSGRVQLKNPRQDKLVLTVNGESGDRLFQVTLRRKVSGENVALSVESEPTVKVKEDNAAVGDTPVTTKPRSPSRRVLTLTEPESGAVVRVVVVVGP